MYVYGKNVAKEILEKNIKIKNAYIYENFNEKEIINKLQMQNINCKFLTKKEIDEMENGNHQGIILDIEDYQYCYLDKLLDSKIIVILDHIEDPHNFGAIIRTCEAAGINSIIIPKDRSVKVNATVMKTSAGTLENVNIARVSNLINAINTLKENGFWIIGTDMEGTDYKNIDYSGKIALVIGNEGKGISRLVEKNCDFIAKIPMYGKVNSLNASVAAALIIYEAVRN